MPIPLTTTILNPIAPSDVTAVGATHFDIYGVGGYRSITTSGTGSLNDQLNAQVSEQRRRVGMLVYDTRVDTYYRLTQVSPGTWTEEDFGGTGSVTQVGMSVPTGLTVSPETITDTGSFSVEIDTAVLSGGVIKVVGGAFANAQAGQDFAAASHEHPFTDITSVPNGKLLGRSSAGAGDAEAVTVSTGLTLTNGVLTAQGSGGTVTAVGGDGVAINAGTTDNGVTYTVAHATSGVVAGTYGSAGVVPKVTVDARGHVTGVATEAITGFLPTSGGNVTGPVALIGVGSNLSVGGNLTITGDLTVNGEQTIVNSNTVQVVDKNLELAINATTDAAADGGGITLHGGTDKLFRWLDATDSWTSSEHLELASGKAFRIDGSQVLSRNTLGTSVQTSSLTSVGTLTGGTWQADAIGLAYGGTGANLTSVAEESLLKRQGASLVAAVAGDDYLDQFSTIDGGSY